MDPKYKQAFDKLLKLKQNVSIGPTRIPSIIGQTDFELTQAQF